MIPDRLMLIGAIEEAKNALENYCHSLKSSIEGKEVKILASDKATQQEKEQVLNETNNN